MNNGREYYEVTGEDGKRRLARFRWGKWRRTKSGFSCKVELQIGQELKVEQIG